MIRSKVVKFAKENYLCCFTNSKSKFKKLNLQYFFTFFQDYYKAKFEAENNRANELHNIEIKEREFKFELEKALSFYKLKEAEARAISAGYVPDRDST